MKKFLSLVLALAMALSLVTISAGATSFDDDGDITYQEAVTVIAGLGIVEGYDDGSFNPTGGLTRGAAAKIICNLILGPTTADALNATSAPFSDVPTTNEFAGYIAYCSQQGIISGYADGTFRPSASLTGYAFMKMLLGALGYDSTYEGYTGSNWSIQVAKQAIGIGLDDGNDDFNGTDNVTREEACLYAFNTLQATLVEYSSSNTVIVGDVQVTTSSDRSEVENNDSNETIEDDDLMQFAEEYFEDLEAEDDTDGFGRPATTWVYDGDELGTYADTADETMVVSDNYDLATWMTDGSYLNYSENDILDNATVYFNGTEEGDYEDVDDDVLTSKGDILEVFENDSGDAETIVIRSYTYARVNEVITDLSSTHENRGATVGIDLVDIDDNSFGTYYDDYNDDDKILKGYNSDYTEDTVIAIALSEDNAILDSYVMESVAGTPTAAQAVDTYSNDRSDTVVSAGTITIDGTRYTYAGQLTGLTDGENVDFDEEYTIYLTADGYVLAVDGDATAALDDVYYVAGVYGERSSGRMTYYAEAVSVSDGVLQTLELSSEGRSDFGLSSSDYDYDTTVAGLYVLDEEDDEYFIDNDYSGSLDDGDEVGSYTVVVSEYSGGTNGLSQDVDSDSTTIRFSNNTSASLSRLYLTDDTFFVSVEGNAKVESLDVTTATGVMTVDADESNQLSAYAFYKTDDSDAVYVLYVANTLAGSVSLSDVVYLTDDANTANSDGYVVDLFFLEDMELAEDVTIDSRDDQGFYTYDQDEDGIYELSVTSSYNLANQNLGGVTNGTEVDAEDESGSSSSGGSGESGESGVTGTTVNIALTDESAEGTATYTLNYLRNQVIATLEAAGYSNVDARDVTMPTSDGIDVAAGDASAERSGQTYYFDVTVTNYWTVSSNGTVLTTVEHGDDYTVEAGTLRGSGTGYVYGSTPAYNRYDEDLDLSDIDEAVEIETGYVLVENSANVESDITSGATMTLAVGSDTLTSGDAVSVEDDVTVTVTVPSSYPATYDTTLGLEINGTCTVDTDDTNGVVTVADNGSTQTVVFTLSDLAGDIEITGVSAEETIPTYTVPTPTVDDSGVTSSASLNVTARIDGDTEVSDGAIVTVVVTLNGTVGSNGGTISVNGATASFSSTVPTGVTVDSGNASLTLAKDTVFAGNTVTFNFTMDSTVEEIEVVVTSTDT